MPIDYSRALAAAALAAVLLAFETPGARAQEATESVPAPASASSSNGDDGAITSQAARRTVGLALGGGSARGFAHIGVLRWFEQHRIPIDYISGTSMGGLIAGAYAAGMSPQAIQDLMKEVDWDLMFIADSPYKYKTFRRKQDKRNYPSQLEFGLKGGLTLPGGLNPGQQIALLFDRIALSYGDMASFDDLPTPFRCVATDLKNAEAVVLGRGSLAQAMRATMAIPGVFTPVNFDNWLLVDGGALNNIPADVTKKMGADTVIAVNVGADSATEAQTRASLVALLGRTIDTMMTTSIRQALKDADIIVDPDLVGLTSGDWRRSSDLADRGYAAAEAMKDKLLPLAMDEATFDAFQAARQARRRDLSIGVPEFLTVIGVDAREEAFIRETLAPVLGAAIDNDTIVDRILTVTGSDRYEYLTYRPFEKDGKLGLEIRARPKAYGPPFLLVSPELTNVSSSTFSVNLGGRVVAYDWVGTGSEVRMDAVVGTRRVLGFEVWRPLGNSPLFVAPRGYYQQAPRNGYVDERLVAEYRFTRAGGGVDLGIAAGRHAEVRLGVDIADVKGRVRIGSPLLPEVDGTEKFGSLSFIWDNQTSPVVPTKGHYIKSRLRYYFSAPEQSGDGIVEVESPQEFSQGEVTGSWFTRVRREDRFFVHYGVGSSFGDHPLVNDFSLGGPLRLSAFNGDELHSSNYLLGGVGYLKKVGRLADVLGGNIYLGGWFESGSAHRDWDGMTYRSSVSLAGVMETLLGPVYLGTAFDFDGRFRFYVGIGPLFR